MRVLARLVLSVLSGSLIAAAPPPRRSTRACCASPMSRDADRLRLRRRHLGGAQAGRRRGAPQLAARRGVVPALLAGRQDARLFRQLRRQHRRLHRARAGRRSVAPDVAPDDRPRARLAPGRHAGPVRVVARERPAALQPVLPGLRQGRAGREAAGPLRRVRHLLARRQAGRLPAAVAGVPHLEALSRRLGARRLDVRPDDQGVGQRHRQRRQRRTPDVARRHALLPLRSRRQPARQHLGPRQERHAAAGDAVRRLRRDVPGPRPRGHRVRGGRPPLPAEPGDREGDAKSPSRSSPTGPR